MSNYKKIGSVAVGVMFLSIIIKSLAPTIYMIGRNIQIFGSAGLLAMSAMGAIIIILIVAVFTARNAIANKLFKDEGDIDVDKSITFPQAVNLVCIFAGLIVLSSAIPAIFTAVNSFIPYVRINTSASCQKIDYGKFALGYREFAFLAALIIKFAIALYPVCGAPHFVRWQIKRIKKLTEETVK